MKKSIYYSGIISDNFGMGEGLCPVTIWEEHNE